MHEKIVKKNKQYVVTTLIIPLRKLLKKKKKDLEYMHITPFLTNLSILYL